MIVTKAINTKGDYLMLILRFNYVEILKIPDPLQDRQVLRYSNINVLGIFGIDGFGQLSRFPFKSN